MAAATSTLYVLLRYKYDQSVIVRGSMTVLYIPLETTVLEGIQGQFNSMKENAVPGQILFLSVVPLLATTEYD